MKAKITKTSANSAIVEPIVIRDGAATRLVFRPQIVNNSQDHNRPVRGDLLWQKRKVSEQHEEWADESCLSLSHMTAGSGVKLGLSTEELYLLTQAVRGLYGVYWEHDHKLPNTGEEFDLADYAKAAKTLDKLDTVAKVISAAGEDEFVALLRWLADHDHAKQVADALPKLASADLAEINSLAGIGILKRALAVWGKNKDNADEAFWHQTLAEHAFVFSQVFSVPVVVFGTKAYVGGKSLEGSGGKEPDFLLKNELMSHLLIVEIKTPATELVGRSPYRPPDVFAVSREVTGAMCQINRYKDEFLTNYGVLKLKSEEEFRLADPRCLIVIGRTDELDTGARKDAFEHFRRGQRSTEIITFDELFKKIEVLIRLLEGRQ